MRGTTCTSVRNHCRPSSLTIQACPSGRLRCRQSWQQKPSFAPKYRAKQFLNHFQALGDMLFCKHSRQNVNWKHAKTTCSGGTGTQPLMVKLDKKVKKNRIKMGKNGFHSAPLSCLLSLCQGVFNWVNLILTKWCCNPSRTLIDRCEMSNLNSRLKCKWEARQASLKV